MRHIKPGRGPSALGALAGMVGVIFGIFWTIMAYSITRDAPKPFAIFFPLFGVVFVIAGIINVVYNIYNTTQKKRLSLFDITSAREEGDPLNNLMSGEAIREPREEPIESKLQKLDLLRAKGILTEAEHKEQRKRILDSI